ncbi:MAG TPA: sigma-70 family RNA polymerase sigma factor [Acidimicrobiales bacterium]|jgi:RNA polymerase sigma-70 factor (ECF subfamily)
MMEPPAHRPHETTTPDEQRFTELFRAHHAQVLAYCRRRLPQDLADDAVAETFTLAWRTLARAPEDHRLWLFGLARGSVANLRRRRDRFARLGHRLATLDHPRAERDHAETAGWEGPFLTAFNSLSEADQEVLRLTIWEDLSPADTGTVLGCSSNAAGVRLHRARQRLRKVLTQAEGGTAPPLPFPSSVTHLGFTDVPPCPTKESR